MRKKEIYLAAAERMDDPALEMGGACAAIINAVGLCDGLLPPISESDWRVVGAYQEAFAPPDGSSTYYFGGSSTYYFGGGRPQYRIDNPRQEREAREARVYSLLLAAHAL